MEKRDSFVLYRSFFEAISELEPIQQAEVYNAIGNFALNGEESELAGIPKAIFALIKPQLLANQKRYVNGCKDKQTTSKTQANDKQDISKQQANDKQNVSKQQANNKQTISERQANENENENENVNDIKESVREKAFRFSPPTVGEVETYCSEQRIEVDANRFVNFYESKGWLVGKTKMKDWQAALRGWESRNNPTAKPTPKKTKWDDRED